MKTLLLSFLSRASSVAILGRALVLLALLLGVTPSLKAHSGHSTWGPWVFDWEVRDDAGLGLRNVHYNGEKVLHKASMPVIRVRYNGNACGPYADRLNWGNLLKISDCGQKKVCQRSYSSGGRQWLEIGVLAAIGKYRIYQAWYLSQDGYMQVRVWSKGFHCNVTHQHHAYWRMDIDVKDATFDQVFVFDNNRPNEGWGPGWHKYPIELNTVKSPATGRVWFVRDQPTGHGIWVLPGSDGLADGFSTIDAAPRLYHGSTEDAPWAFGASGELGYLNGEPIAERDIVFWYTAHLAHSFPGDPNHWEAMGPTLKVAR